MCQQSQRGTRSVVVVLFFSPLKLKEKLQIRKCYGFVAIKRDETGMKICREKGDIVGWI